MESKISLRPDRKMKRVPCLEWFYPEAVLMEWAVVAENGDFRERGRFDVAETLDSVLDSLSPAAPIRFRGFDLDLYSSTVAAFDVYLGPDANLVWPR